MNDTDKITHEVSTSAALQMPTEAKKIRAILALEKILTRLERQQGGSLPETVVLRVAIRFRKAQARASRTRYRLEKGKE